MRARGTMPGMTDQGERYDRIAAGYARWWAPVLAPAVIALLDRLGPDGMPPGARVVDVGTGTGQLAIAAIERWPSITVDGVDVSAGMCAAAATEADRRLAPELRDRFRTTVGTADRLPFDDGTFDVALSSFVLQLVPNRHRAFRDIRRVLRPGGTFTSVTWVAGRVVFAPDDAFDDALDAVGEEPRWSDGRSGDFETAEAALHEYRRAGFSGVAIEAGLVEHRFGIDDYLAFMTEFDEETLIAELDDDVRERFLADLRRRLTALTPERMTLRLPIVYATGRR
jgi:SAM-dependent methyltransferase